MLQSSSTFSCENYVTSKPLMNEEKASEEWESLVAVRSKGGGGGNSSSSIAERRAKMRRFKGSGTINTSRSNLAPLPLSSPAAIRSPYQITTPSGISPTTLLDSPIMPPTVSQTPISSEIPIDSPKAGASSCATEASANTRVSKSMTYPSRGVARTCEDGYNWRKYGQKNVKTSQYPRSYYKCTHPNCKVKRKLQCSPDGQITEIMYDGVHCHPRQQRNRQEILRTSFLHNQMSEASDGSDEAGSDWEFGGLETSTSVLTANSDPWSNSEAKLSCAIFESNGTPELSLGDDAAADDDEPESKKRKTEISAHKPRVVFLIDSGVDALDDGYCWRKYGKKFVKGNVNPRSYYKCTSTGCPVRKQMERASQNWKSVCITYDGKHTHEVPAAGNLNQGGGWTISPTASSTRPNLAFVRNANGPKAEAQSQDHSPFFQRTHLDLDNETVLSALLGDSKSAKKIESPPLAYQLKLKNSLLSGSFGPNFPMPSSPLSVSTSGSMEPSCSNGNHGWENGFAHYCFGRHERLWENDTRSIEPYKQEQRDDNLRGIPLLPMVNHTNAPQTSSSSSSSSSWSVWSV
ncbi:hypothetical protein RHMOL_Rhmol05G0224900 [Rhododendron molle]|uniref:Uncharacterized protein n=1 Tax=Rhododendron molle TaxID=49168 RepID=A0ACC0NSA8_RHOML|nr:hypothetical protein RHMOL_Rhmol05G0224900 [Rhododendron molle]